jgi:hypothetical protein
VRLPLSGGRKPYGASEKNSNLEHPTFSLQQLNPQELAYLEDHFEQFPGNANVLSDNKPSAQIIRINRPIHPARKSKTLKYLLADAGRLFT